jgi:hypothetical protein
VRIADVDGLQLDQQLVAHRHRLGRRTGELLQVRTTRVGQGEHPLVGPPLLAHQARVDEPFGIEPVEFAVQLLRGGRPEVGNRHIEALCELISGRLAFQQGGQYCVTQRHLDGLPTSS